MSDPVAEKSKFLCMYMSNHPDTLVAYVKHWGKIKDPVESASMTAIDMNGMNLTYKVRGLVGQTQAVRVTFQPPLSGYEEVKPRLLGMTADAYEALGMAKTPQVTTFELPGAIYQTGILLSLLWYTTFSPSYEGSIWSLGQWLHATVGGSRTLKVIWYFVAVVHLAEAAYVQRLCVRHRTGISVGAKYVLSTLTFGFPVLLPFLRKIQQARIDSIMKGN